jgi:histidinol-phosphate/aromatic aminotransferase/cobyric acid decarboxylase-like protein/molybdopterin-guanine dinucleotide biosynthesis protein A
VAPAPTRAVILAAGRGLRLGLPCQSKVLAPVAGVPLLLRTLRTLAAAHVRTVVIVVGHRAEDVMAAVAGNEAGMRVMFVRSPRFATTNNAYSLWLAREWLTEDLFVLDGDVVFDAPILAMLHATTTAAACGVARWRAGLDGTVLELTTEGLVSAMHPNGGLRVGETAAGMFKTINVHLLRRDYLEAEFVPLLSELIASGGEQSFYEEVLARTVRRGRHRVAGVDCTGVAWQEVDDGTDLEIASFVFGSAGQRQDLLARQHGGYWRHPVTDHCLLTNPFFPPADLLAELAAGIFGAVTGYPVGQDRLRELLSAVVGLPPAELAVANGASELIRALGRILTRVALVVPCFGEYEAVFGEPPITMPWPSLHVDVDQVYDEAMRLGARAVIIESPANPTSRQVPADDLLRLAALLARTSARLIVDESFADFGAAPRTLGAHLATNPNIVIIRSLSKAYGVAGLRLGYLACADEDLLGAVLAELPIWNINGLAEAFLRLLPRYGAAFDESIAQVRAARDELYTMMCQRPCFAQVHRPDANFVLARLADPLTAAEIALAMLARHGIMVKDCSGKSMPRAESYLRLASRTGAENQRLVAAIDDIMATLPERRS